jgi:hypothetical protein
MGADKKSSPKRELGLCPKFTTKNSHTSLPRSRSHNRPTNPRNKPQTIPKRKRNSWSKRLSSTAKPQADCPRPPGEPSAWVRQTVRKLRRTVQKTFPNHQYCTLKNGPSVLYPRIVRAARTVRTLLADRPQNLVQPKAHGQTDQKIDEQEHTKKSTNCWLKASSRTLRRGVRTVRVVRR